MTALRHVEAVRSLDRSVSDVIMRELARERLADVQSEKSVRYVFINVGEATCRIWAKARGEACATGFATPRDELVEMLKALASANAGRTPMKLVVLDVELAPQVGDKASDTDKLLCAETYSIAKSIPVLAVRPVVSEASNPARPVAQAYPSIFDDSKCSPDASPSSHPDLWFASPLLQPDPDNVVRSVYAWHLMRGDTPAAARRISGFGLLGAALMDAKVDRSGLACLFPASRPGSSAKCEAKPLNVANHVYEPSDNDDLSVLRILFSLPSDPGSAVTAAYSYAPFVFQTIEADELQQRLSENLSLLDGAVVVIGGGYAASGDLHATPLGLRMPGAMVHANAIRAIASGTLVDEYQGWAWELLLIGLASSIGAVFHVAGHQAHERLRSPVNHIAKLVLAALAIVVTILAVFFLGAVHAFSSLAAGTAIAVMSPIIAVAFEGMSSILQVIREALSAALTWVEAIGSRPHIPPASE
ncbi:CHASE2 domain-containing protein [Mesorhizobium sp. NZP2077]|uniref:CHASE2 domain-containing protein n=1 Tax=Mesorhizobium sp. NZP2077 TaxID=2483404 RepID=UPI001551DAA4|nr:CHASE2 domain-containing protein [Mesorhizobium sp. NZP2077]QKD19079.1 CHASE2 domain-containing protein [Mesorhizobium sp. NZP2077]